MEIEFLVLGAVVLVGVALVIFMAVMSGATSRQSRDMSEMAEERDRQMDDLSGALAALAQQQSELGGRFSQLAESQAANQTAVSKSLEERLDALTKRGERQPARKL